MGACLALDGVGVTFGFWALTCLTLSLQDIVNTGDMVDVTVGVTVTSESESILKGVKRQLE